MKKNISSKKSESSFTFLSKVKAVLQSESIHFIIGLILILFSVYLLLAFSSFFFTGAADQSIIESGTMEELASTNNGVKNYAGFSWRSAG